MARFGFRNDAQLTRFRVTSLTALPDNCTVQDYTVAGTPTGGKTTTPTGAARPYKCRFESKLVRLLSQGEQSIKEGRIEMAEKITCYLPYNADVKQTSKITHTETGYVYKVTAVSHDSAWPILQPCTVERVFTSGE